MKIAVITDTYYTINGVSRTYQEMVRYCQAKKIRLDIFTLGKRKNTKKKGTVNIFQFAASLPLKYYFDLPPFDLKIIPPGFKEKLNKTKYDIIHLATPGSLGIAARMISAENSIPKIGCFHTLLAEYVFNWTEKGLKKIPLDLENLQIPKFSQDITWIMLKWFYAKTDLILAPSKVIADKIKILNKPIKIFSRGVDTEIFNPKYRNKKIENEKPTGLYVGRLSLEKNLDLLAEIFKNRNDCNLWLAGDGPYKKSLEKKIPRAKFLKYVTGKKLAEIYANADFFIFPSATDTFGNAVLEAQSSGLPCIVTNIGGPKELIKNKKTGLISKPTKKDFEEALNYFIKNGTKRKKMGQKARTFAETKSWNKVFEELFKIYQKLGKN